MNRASFLPWLAAVAFALPLLTQLGQAVGVPRPFSMALTLLVAASVGLLVVLRYRTARKVSRATGTPPAPPPSPNDPITPAATWDEAEPFLVTPPSGRLPLFVVRAPTPAVETDILVLKEKPNARV